MTEKRFTETVSTGDVHDTLTGKSYRCEYRIDDEFLELVNNIAEENEQLKQQLNDCREYNEKQYANYTKNDRQFVKEIRGWEKSYDELKKENEQLKSENLILKGKLHQLRLKCGKQEEEIECLSEETIEKFKQDLQDGNFIEFTAR